MLQPFQSIWPREGWDGRTFLLLAPGPFSFFLSMNKTTGWRIKKKNVKIIPVIDVAGEEREVGKEFGLGWVLGAQIPLPDLNLFMSMK